MEPEQRLVEFLGEAPLEALLVVRVPTLAAGHDHVVADIEAASEGDVPAVVISAEFPAPSK